MRVPLYLSLSQTGNSLQLEIILNIINSNREEREFSSLYIEIFNHETKRRPPNLLLASCHV